MFKLPKIRQLSIVNCQLSPAGFSLIELLVTFSMVAIISGIGFASFVGQSRRQAIVQSRLDVKQAVEVARFNAISNVKPAGCNTGTLASYIISFCIADNPSCTTAGDGNGYEVKAVCGSQKILVLSKNLSQNLNFTDFGVTTLCQDVTFNAVSSVISGTPCQITVSGYSRNSTVNISRQGFVSYD